MQFASRVSNASSILSPLARPYHADGSVAAYLHDQARSHVPAVTSPTPEYNEQNMQRLETMLKELGNMSVSGDEDGNKTVQRTHTDHASQLLFPSSIPLPVLPVHTRLIFPPTSAESTELLIPHEPGVRVTMHAWDAMGRDLKALKEEKRALELKLAHFEKQAFSPSVNRDKEYQTEIGHLKYQNEQNRTQKAAMASSLSQKDIEIKQLQLALVASKDALDAAKKSAQSHANIIGERDYLQDQVREERLGRDREIAALAEAKSSEIQNLTQLLDDARESKKKSQNNEHKTLADTRLEALSRYEKQLKSVNAKYASEHDRANRLEGRVEDIKGQLHRVENLQTELSQKSSECDRWRTKYKNQEKMVDTCKQQIERARNENQSLRGAAHLVKPAPTSKLSPLVLGCTECYTMNITCDNKARCRNCTENNEQCSRWRCSLKHRLGQCPMVPCTFPHEEDGWLLAPEPRPQW